MKQSSLQVRLDPDRPDMLKLNRVRMIQQNKRLLVEIQKLDHIISTIIVRNAENEFEFLEEGEGLRAKYQQQQQKQLRQIKLLQKEVKVAKAQVTEQVVDDVKREENLLVFMRREHDRLTEQILTLTRKKHEKQAQLEYYKPLNNQVAQTGDAYRRLKSQNAELKMKLHQKQKEVAKYHKIKQLSKSAVAKDVDNPNFHLLRMQADIQNMRKEMGRIDDKWRTKIESLDNQYFAFKSIINDKQHQIEMLEKESKNWEQKSAYFRDQNAVNSDRQRIGSVSISPQKRKQMQELIDDAKRRGKKIQPKMLDSKSKAEKVKKEPSGQMTASLSQVSEASVFKEMPNEKESQKQLQKEVMVAKQVAEPTPQEQSKKASKAFESVGVGTSFYYADD